MIINDFNWIKYKELNPYLYIIGLRSEKEYTDNYFNEGIYKGRIYNESQSNNSYHVLLATIGKSSIFNILIPLRDQLSEIDFLTIVFDGIDNSKNIDIVKSFCKDFKCKVNIILEEKNLGFWGHGIRNKYNQLDGDFIFHVDDDDIIFENTFNIIRKYCVNKNIIYIFKIMLENNALIWKKKEIKYGNISTQSGIIPNKINSTGYWVLKYGGDFDFYKNLCEKNNYIFMDYLIYKKNGNKKKINKI